MEVKLKVRVGANAGKELSLPAPKFFIGRAEDCHLRPKSDLISRHHCVLLVEESALCVRDLGSRNGTYVNDERVLGERELKAGDILKVGPLEFDVLIVPLATPQKRPKVTSIREAAARTAEGRAGEDVDLEDWFESQDAVVSSSAPNATAPVSAPVAPVAVAPAPTPQTEAETREMESVETEEIKLGATLLNLPSTTSAPPAVAPKLEPVPIPTAVDPDAETTVDAAEASSATADSPNAATEDQAPSKPATGAKPGKLPFRPRSADSRSAAADTLRKFFNRR